jgi:PadR family transcriptional regulator, regulatory protein AphA
MAAKISATEAALLGLLTRGELSGYDLQRAGERSGGFFWAPTKSRIYAVLPQLVERGFATSREVTQQGRPTKQLYRITKSGRAALQVWLEEPPVFDPERAPLLLKLYFGDLLEPEIVLGHIRKARSEVLDLKRRLEAQPPESGSLYADLTLRQGLEWARAMIRWTSTAEQELLARLRTPVQA